MTSQAVYSTKLTKHSCQCGWVVNFWLVFLGVKKSQVQVLSSRLFTHPCPALL
jgi:hypothetical protein